jgi:peptide/nickel transport system permease protein
MIAVPGAAISLTVLGLNLLSDALRTAFNPRLRRKCSAEAALEVQAPRL